MAETSPASPAAAPAAGRVDVHRSIFAKLLVIMVAMAVSLLALVISFFLYAIGPALHHSVNGVLEDYTTRLAASGISQSEAEKLHTRLNLELRYQGPAGDWATSPGVPRPSDLAPEDAPGRTFVLVQPKYYVKAAPDGGQYVFSWSLGRQLRRLHDALLVSLVLVMVAVVVAAYWVLRTLLNPVRTLMGGLASLGSGDLQVSIPIRSQDELGQLTLAFNQMAERIHQMVLSRDQLLVDVSHELRSPLTRLKVALELTPPHPRKEGMARDLAEMEQMVSELLELERLRTGRGLDLRPHDLAQLAEDVARPFQSMPPGLEILVPAEPVIATVDPEKFRMLLRNILENAAKYSGPGSGRTVLRMETTATSVVLRIADDGPGVPPEHRERIFEPFYRADPSRAKSPAGYGLGLSMAKRIALAHGGDLILEATSGRGATFVVTLPRSA